MILATKAAIAHSGGPTGLDYRWVVMGLSGNCQTSDSTTAASWTSRTSSFGSTNIRGVASNGTNLYVAVASSGKLATSPDAITWTQQTSSFGTDDIRSVCYGAGLWVAVGESGKIATSSDGVTWTQRASGTTTEFNAVAYGDGLYVAGGSNMMRTSPDGITWTTRSSTLTQLGALNSIYYAPDQGVWVAGHDSGTTGALASSTNGTTWTARTSSFSLNGNNVGGFASTASIIVHGVTLVIFPADCDVQTSTDGTSWTNRTPATSAALTYGVMIDKLGTFVTVSSGPQLSTNGTSWSNAGTGPVGAQCGTHSSGVPAIR